MTGGQYEGLGSMVEFVDTWNAVFSALDHPRVIQPEFLGRKAEIKIEPERLVLQF